MGILDAPALTAAQKNIPNGVAGLDGGGLIGVAQLPSLAISDVFQVTSQAQMLALSAQRGDVAVRTDTTPIQSFMLAADVPGVLSNWIKLSVSWGSLDQIPTAVASVGLGGQRITNLGAPTSATDADTKGARDTAIAVETTRAQAAEILLIPLAQKGAASGVASLDGGGKVPVGQLPSLTALGAAAASDLTAETTARTNADTAEATARANADALLIPLTQKGANSGVATLDSTGKVPAGQLPDSVGSGGAVATGTPGLRLTSGLTEPTSPSAWDLWVLDDGIRRWDGTGWALLGNLSALADGGTPASSGVDDLDGGVPGTPGLNFYDGGDPVDPATLTLDGGTP